jgi:hypothetical protein
MTKKFNLDAIESQAARFISGVKRPDAESYEGEAGTSPGESMNTEARAALIGGEGSHENEGKKPGRPKVYSRETRSLRINVLVRPSIVDRLKKVSAIKRKSVNDLINTYLDERLELESDALKKFDEVFGDEA